MENELSIKKDGLISLSENNNLGNMIKPLMREIHLFDSFIAGTTHLSDPSVLQEIKVGDKLSLMREDNKFDHINRLDINKFFINCVDSTG